MDRLTQIEREIACQRRLIRALEGARGRRTQAQADRIAAEQAALDALITEGGDLADADDRAAAEMAAEMAWLRHAENAGWMDTLIDEMHGV